MANTKKYVSLDKLYLYDEKIKKFLADADDVVLASAKAYSDSKDSQFEAAGSVATAQAALQKNIDAVSAAADAAQAAADKAQGEVDALETLVGTLPAGTAAESVVAYVDLKTAGIATDAALGELNNQVSGLQTVVNGITADYLTSEDKTELSDAIAAEETRAKGVESGLETRLKAVEDDYLTSADAETLQGNVDGVAERVAAIEGDYLKAADKTELEGKIALKADQTALDSEVERATKAEESLQTQINTIMNNPDTEGVINSINEFTQYIADHGEIADGFREDIDQNKADIAAEVKRAGEAESALSGRLDTLEAIDHDAYVDADSALKTELSAEIAKKADASALTSAVEALEGVDEGFETRIAALEAKHGDGEGTVESMVAAAKQEAIDAAAADATEKANQALADAKADASSKDAVVLTEAKGYADAVQTALDTHTGNADIHVTAEQKTAWTTAAGKAHEHSNLEVLEGITAAKVTAWDAAEGNAKTYADGLNTAMDTRVTALETWHNNFTEVSEEEINSLFA